MNKKQIIILILEILAIVLIVWLTPRYKITDIGGNNYIITEQTSSLYERTHGAVKLHWGKVFLYTGITIPVCGLFVWVLRRKNE